MTDCDSVADRAFVPVQAAIAAGRIPGAVLGVLGGGDRAIRHAGLAQRVPEPVPLRADTVFDLASLTKPVFTTTQILRLCDAGRLDLDDTLAKHVPDLRQYDVAHAAERRLTLRQCLSHQTHLPAVEPLYTYGQPPATLRAFILQRAWQPGPPVYSDINFLLLGILLERVTGQRLDALDPGPGFTFTPAPADCAATEFCPWRGRVLRGEVHDENAAAMGEGAGHAGLFGTADALLDFAASLLDGSAMSAASLQALRTPVSPTRSVGWDMAHPGWAGGSACSPGTIGHTGFTGTGLWIDWRRGWAWALLTNRVHPSRHAETGIQALRRVVGDTISAGMRK